MAGADLKEQLREPPQGLGAEDQIHVAVGGPDPSGGSLLLGHAAAQADGEIRIALLGVDQLAHHAKDLLLRVLPDGAGVDDNDLRPAGVLGEAAAHVPQHPHEPLAVRHVLLAAVGLDAGQGRPPGAGLVQLPQLLAEAKLPPDVLLADPLCFSGLSHGSRSLHALVDLKWSDSTL